MNVGRILLFVQKKCALSRIFMSFPNDVSRCDSEGFQMQVVPKKENFIRKYVSIL